jgi:peptide subunit release factor 1 (eRF1)
MSNLQDENIKVFQFKKLLEQLDSARGNATSVITLLITPSGSIQSTLDYLSEKLNSTDRIKSSI